MCRMGLGCKGMARQLFEVHVAAESPERWDQQEALVRASTSGPGSLRRRRESERSQLSGRDFAWEALGVVPRFLGSESTDCVAALQPNIFSGHGDEELKRFLSGAAARGETALLVSMIGQEERQLENPLAPHDSSILLPGLRGGIAGRRLPEGAGARIVDGLGAADKDLALRLRNRPTGSPWWAIKPSPIELAPGNGTRSTVHEPGGKFEPILVNAIGETLAGVWIPDGENWRWYFVPWGKDWRQLIEWLVERAVPEYVPDALRRVRAAELVDDELLTGRELAARDALARFEESTSIERARLDAEIATAQAAADDVRFGLLYGTSRLLVLTVKRVLEEAGFAVDDLDDQLGPGVSGDLLVSYGALHWLVEVKSASGSVGEHLVDDLQRHQRTWPELKRPQQLSGGVLVVNYEYKLPPLERQREPYTHVQFVASLPVPVVSTLALFGWWRESDYAAVVQAVTGAPCQYRAGLHRREWPLPEAPADADGKSVGLANAKGETHSSWRARLLRRRDSR